MDKDSSRRQGGDRAKPLRSDKRAHSGSQVAEVSIIGGGFEHFLLKNRVKGKHSYVFLRVEEDEHDLLVKILRIRDLKRGESLKTAEFVRDASDREILRLMSNMVKGYLWESGVGFKIGDVDLDRDKGVLTVEYISDKPVGEIKKIAASLASLLHVRVEFVQVSGPQYASRVGWLGRCGLELCCRVWKRDIPSVTQDMARRQYLFAAPDKLTGACGRLLCCLTYELPFYDEAAKVFPKLNSLVSTENGEAEVMEVNVVAGYYVLKYKDGKKEKVYLDRKA